MSWALVTGGAKHLGASICRRLANNGISLIIHYYQSEKEAIELKEECISQGVEVRLIQGDFSKREGIKEFTDKLVALNLPIRYVVNNVGNYLIKNFTTSSEEEWYSLFSTNLHAPFSIIKAISASLLANEGAVVNIGVAGLLSRQADTYSSAYMITKQALLMLTKSFAKEYVKQNVTVNMLSPGHLVNSVDLPDDVSKLPLQRPVNYEEVSAMICYLFSDKAKSITGQNIEIAGGVRL